MQEFSFVRLLRLVLLFLSLGLQSYTLYAVDNVEYRFERIWPHLDKLWYFNHPQGIAVASNGNVYVADSYNNQVQVLNADGEYIRSWGSIGKADGSFDHPYAIAIAADGSVYVAEKNNHRVQQFSATGEFMRKWGGNGKGKDDQGNTNGSGNNDGEFLAPQGIAIAPNGNVVVADSGNHRIQIFKADGTFIRKFGRSGSEEGQFNFPLGIAVAKNGELYVADTGNNRIQQFSAEGGFIRKWNNAATSNTNNVLTPSGPSNGPNSQAPDPMMLTGPMAVTLVADQVLVSDSKNNRIQVFSLEGKFIRMWGSTGSAKGSFDKPAGMALGSNGNLYVADGDNNRIQQFSYTTQESLALRVWGSSGSDDGQFRDPVSVAITANADILVVEKSNNRVQQFTSDGVFVRKWGQFGSDKGQFNEPFGIAISADKGSVFISDTNNHRIQQFTLEGVFLRTWGSNGSGNAQFNMPKGIAVAADGSVYVADRDNHRVQQFSSTGSFIRSWGGLGEATGKFNEPQSIAITPNGQVYVADKQNDRIQQFTPEGVFVRSWNIERQQEKTNVVKRTIEGIEGLTALRDGSLMLADSRNQSIQQYSAEGKLVATLGKAGAGDSQFHYPSGVAAYSDASNDVIVVADMSNHRVQKFVARSKTNLTAVTTTGNVQITHPYKAIILAGAGETINGRSNNIWEGTWRIALKANKALSAQGFTLHDEILFLTAGSTEFDLDANGKLDDLSPASLQSLQQAITQWAGDAKDVVIYLADHGGPGKFQVNDTEILTGETLGAWVEQLDKIIPGKISVIIEACNSGSFLPYLAKSDRYLFSSVQADQAAVISNEGFNSFSYFFWSEVMGGAKLQNAFKDARQAMSATTIAGVPRNAQADTDGNKQFTQEDLNTLGTYCIGNCNATAGLAPTLKPIVLNSKTLQGEQTLNFSVEINALQGIDSAWFLVHRPDDLTIDPSVPLNFEKIALSCNAQYKCSGNYSGFDTQGEYQLAFFAIDAQQEVSSPETVSITQTVGKPINPSVYDSSNNILYLRDVTVGEQHYQAALQWQNGQFLLKAANKISHTFSPAASFDPDVNQLNIPEVLVAGKMYQANLKHLGNYVFQLGGVTPLSR